jgi:hypothetical protein
MPFPVDEKYVLNTEEQLKVKFPVSFPVSFREKMMKENGGTVETSPDAWDLYPFFDTSDKKRIKRTSNNIFRETNVAREWDTFPKDAIAIGANGSGDQLIFMRSSVDPQKCENTVYWWDHETGDINKIANDFKEIA